MDKFEMQYSSKNIPIPSQEDYKIQLISKTELLLKRMRWKALAFLGKLQKDETEKYGFRSRNCPPIVNDLASFEDDIQLMIKNITFKRANNPFQTQLKSDI